MLKLNCNLLIWRLDCGFHFRFFFFPAFCFYAHFVFVFSMIFAIWGLPYLLFILTLPGILYFFVFDIYIVLNYLWHYLLSNSFNILEKQFPVCLCLNNFSFSLTPQSISRFHSLFVSSLYQLFPPVFPLHSPHYIDCFVAKS